MNVGILFPFNFLPREWDVIIFCTEFWLDIMNVFNLYIYIFSCSGKMFFHYKFDEWFPFPLFYFCCCSSGTQVIYLSSIFCPPCWSLFLVPVQVTFLCIQKDLTHYVLPKTTYLSCLVSCFVFFHVNFISPMMCLWFLEFYLITDSPYVICTLVTVYFSPYVWLLLLC